MFISRLRVHGFKRLQHMEVGLSDLTVLVGPNSSGKTALLEAVRVLSRSADRALAQAVADLGGMVAVMSRGGDGLGPHFALRVPVTSSRVALYELTLRTVQSTHEVETEELWSGLAGVEHADLAFGFGLLHGVRVVDPELRGWDPRLGLERQETLLSDRPPGGSWVDELRAALASIAFYGPVDAGPDAPIRLPQQVRPARLPRPSGEYLASTLQYKRSRDRWMFDRLEGVLRTAYPGFEGLDFEPVAAGSIMLTWSERGKVYYANELSEGTLRFLLLASLLLTTELPALVLIDEPEVSLHPELLCLLSDLLQDASSRTQLLVATQSPELISWLKPEQIVVLDLDDEGWCQATPGDQLNLEDWLKDYTLGQLWTKGVIGGRS